jgi:carboxylate-amine ligase
MKDFYWDIRPKPEYGTVEIRVFDTPLTVERAAALATYAQTLVRYILAERPFVPSREVYVLYNYNRFQACRYGLEGKIVDAYSKKHLNLREDILETVARISLHAVEPGAGAVIHKLAEDAGSGRSDAEWLRQAHRDRGSLNDVARMQSDLWMGRVPVPA